MTLCEEIREKFASLSSVNNGFLELSTLPAQYPGYIYVDSNGYSVAIRCDNDLRIKEYFAGASYSSESRIINNQEVWFIVLNTRNVSLRNEFAALCAEFLEPGENGLAREKILRSPLNWWNNWKELLGNSAIEKSVYSVIAEMFIFSKMYENDKSLKWAAIEAGSHDIEGDAISYEVKSTLRRYDTLVTIAGQFQLLNKKPLFLMFCRMEKSKEGSSIDDMVRKLISQGYDEFLLENQLQHMGYEKNMSDRKRKYKIHEIRKIAVDDNFPRIVPESFKDCKIPDYVQQITYTLDLGTYPYEKIDI